VGLIAGGVLFAVLAILLAYVPVLLHRKAKKAEQ
jgi:hypothetical protein